MDQGQIKDLLSQQRRFFDSGRTLDVSFRLGALHCLREAVRRREADICAALREDLGKSRMESYMCEVGLTLSEITYMLRHVRSFASERRVPTPLAQFAARSCTKPSPYGVNLIMSPWNYPFLLTIGPLVDALAAGNTAVLKPSAYAPASSALLEALIGECFEPSYAAVVAGGREENRSLLREPFDHIFFTGSQSVGREVLRQAAERLTPVTLELGGKSPCIVDRTARIPLAARRIVFGKFLNCGQTCVAPDYVLCHEQVHDQLVEEIVREIKVQFGDEPLKNPDYGKIINKKHFDRVSGLITPEKVAFGGQLDPDACRIAPTVLDGVSWDEPVMGEEIFGPVLPVLTFRELEEAVRTVNGLPHPLALYIFSQSREAVRTVTSRCAFGGGCVNDTVIHLATSHMGFGGVGSSGMGAYHGRAGFETFSHRKSIVDKRTWPDLPMRYQPYSWGKEKLVRRFLR